MSRRVSRRAALKGGLAAGAGAAGVLGTPGVLYARSRGRGGSLGDEFGHVPFSVPLPKPKRAMEVPSLDPAPGSPAALVGSSAVFHGIAPEFFANHPVHVAANANANDNERWDQERFMQGGGPNGEKLYHFTMKEGTHEFIDGVSTKIFGYADDGDDGIARFPGPTFVERQGQPIVVRYCNELEVETSVHVHGDHTPAHSDGYPDFYVLQGKKRDYYYPNIGPRQNARPGSGPEAGNTGPYELSGLPTTMWYHDHGMDITGFNVSRGLAGFYLIEDDLEQGFIDSGVLPELYGPYDIPLALQDQQIDSDGQLPYDFLDHNGRVGPYQTVNGKLQPYVTVERRKYRFRILNASNARLYQLRLTGSDGSQLPFLQIGQDTWELPHAITLNTFELSMSQRVDCIVDFRNAPDEVFLENIMLQKDGRKPDGVDPEEGLFQLLKFKVEGPPVSPSEDLSVKEGMPLRPFTPILAEEINAVRRFVFERRNGAWQVNHQFFSPRRSNAVPLLNSAEKWILENKSGGWLHPIHIHLEAHQIQKLNGKAPPPSLAANVGASSLDPNGTSEIFMKFRTFTGPLVFHCHTLEHEDMRMMAVFDPRAEGHPSLNNGVRAHNSSAFVDEFGFTAEEVSGMPIVPDSEVLFFDATGDVDRLEGRGVGFEEFEPGELELFPPPDNPGVALDEDDDD
jgi:FtsP/CotA-like multicopper oxidase with cupredoxin domain